MPGKEWWKSKTIWFNVLALVATVATNWGYTGDLPADWQVFVPVVVVVVNLIMRLVTKEPLRWRAGS